MIELPPQLWQLVQYRASGQELKEHCAGLIKAGLDDANNKRMGYWSRHNGLQRARAAWHRWEGLRDEFKFQVCEPLDPVPAIDLTEALRKQQDEDSASN